MPLFSTSGSRLFIAPERVMGSDLGWTEVKSVVGLGRIAGTWKTTEYDVPSQYISGEAETVVEKAVRPVREMQVAVATDIEDEGQEMLLAAYDSTERFAFRIDLSDGSGRRFLALVTGMEDAFDEANTLMTMVFSLTMTGCVERTIHAGGG